MTKRAYHRSCLYIGPKEGHYGVTGDARKGPDHDDITSPFYRTWVFRPAGRGKGEFLTREKHLKWLLRWTE